MESDAMAMIQGEKFKRGRERDRRDKRKKITAPPTASKGMKLFGHKKKGRVKRESRIERPNRPNRLRFSSKT